MPEMLWTLTIYHKGNKMTSREFDYQSGETYAETQELAEANYRRENRDRCECHGINIHDSICPMKVDENTPTWIGNRCGLCKFPLEWDGPQANCPNEGCKNHDEPGVYQKGSTR